jgi:hypothetical protein
LDGSVIWLSFEWFCSVDLVLLCLIYYFPTFEPPIPSFPFVLVDLVLVWGRTGERKLQIVKPGFEPGQPAPRPDRPAQNPVNRPQTGAAGPEAGQPAHRPEQPAPHPVRPDHRPDSSSSTSSNTTADHHHHHHLHHRRYNLQ